jgi:hypothetical protein
MVWRVKCILSSAGEMPVHHTVHIGAVKLQAVNRAPASGAAVAMKAPDDARFRETFTASIRPVAAAKGTGQEQSREDGTEAQISKPPPPVVAPSPKDRAPSRIADDSVATDEDGIPKTEIDVKAPVPTQPRTANPKEVETQLPQPPTGTVTAKKSLHKDIAHAKATTETPAMAAAQTPVPVAAPVPVAVPTLIPLAPPDITARVRPEEPAMSTDVSAKASKSPGSMALARAPKHDAKKGDAAPTVASAEPKPDVASQIIAIALPVVQQDLGHAANSIESPAIAIGAGGSAHASAVSATTAVAKTSDAQVAGAAFDGVSQATDLKTLVATPNVLEVGIASGSHGWLRVRAEFGQMGEVAASVVAASPGAAVGLHKELPALSAYLAGEQVGVSSLVVNAAEKGAGAQDAALNNGAGGAAGSQDGTSQRNKHVPGSTPTPGGSEVEISELTSDAGPGVGGINLPALLQVNGSGSWLSVRV